jgi:serine/threonine protein kinase
VLDDPLDLIGVTIHGGFEVRELVSFGGLSLVYRVVRPSDGCSAALKCYDGLADLPEPSATLFRERFGRVGGVIADLSSSHDGLVRFVAQGWLATRGRELPCLILEWLEGTTLERLLDRERDRGLITRSASEVLELMREPMRALAAAHEHGVVHRDLKPSNLYVCGSRLDRGTRIKVLDFMLAKFDDEGSGGHAVSFMTPDYAAPEQFLGVESLIGPWTDVFSLALVLVEMMLGGRAALRGEDFESLKRASLDSRHRPTPGSFGLDVSNGVESVFKRALAVDVRNRFPNVGRFLAALTRAVEAHGRLTSTGLSRVSGELFHEAEPTRSRSLHRSRRRNDVGGTRIAAAAVRPPDNVTGDTVVAPGPVRTGHTVLAPMPKFED